MISVIDINQHILQICSTQYDEFLSLPGVVGVALSYKIINNMVTDEPCIQVLVENKMPLNKLRDEHVIPSIYKGIATDIFETGVIEAYSNRNSRDLFKCGYSIGPSSIENGGTAGAIVKSTFRNKASYHILSNNHVLASENNESVGISILYPSVVDGGVYPRDEIATLSKFIPINFIDNINMPINKVDCAMAIINKPYEVSPYIAGIGLPTGTCSSFIGQEVKKSGRSTGLTNGIVVSIGATVRVAYNINKKKALFKNQILTTPMSLKGDSGSLLVDKYGRAVGLLFSGSETVTLYNPIEDVLSSLNVTLVTPNNFAL